MFEFSKLNQKVFINLDITTDALRYLIVHYKSNNIASLSPALGNGIGQYLKIAKAIIRKKLGKSGKVIRLPIAGSLALVVHQGYKIFNYKDGTVSKIFEKSTSEATIVKEVTIARNASRLEFAPKFITKDINKGFFTEELVSGQLAAVNARENTDFSRNLYSSHIVDYMARMIATDQEQHIPIKAMLQVLSEFINNDDLSGLEGKYPELTEIKYFFNHVCDDLMNNANDSVIKCYSHGDFSLENIIFSNESVKVIDWEGAESRSILNDFYNYFFTEMYYKRLEMSPDILKSAHQQLLDRLDSESVKEHIEAHDDMYRKIFYLERIKTCLERNLTKNAIKVTINSVLLFKGYESLNTG